ncbi:facilitated trehalose transporter Tret1-2 homolog isoform X1 [Diabrotica virgifera virgifera]|uniref:Facilitated trehalose transporter Tret1-2 homolog isoform X2 n=2 Tax=Diabrotica virgifera virgifera TaxID=50390 RepID=A0A6P7H6S1_DIAVI|nr:facilitated trehalose transporter Tret1-2 homolog isoform X1 [Diabrotica virgifera virgifera]XP_050499119.1 facilitated trehalose transporter Tret1-2 homolog isoform X1 [Diabrotica virgifera virgifera]XP_050499120.1 facilitated trehalose transporter Tret1-2 homolog isoform X1 [Diabrotica virgifera virgifera]XP_050499121.1 facilitated trehalose transporter Tret1-2 homolog isoform X1 [Diabrotica virgifera virgifera]
MGIKEKINYAYLVAFCGNLLALTGDTTLTWSSPILTKLDSNDTDINPLGRKITLDEISWIGSLQYIGAMVGILPFAVLADVIGRKPVLLLLAVPHIISFLSFAFAKTIGWYYVGRFLGGVSLSSVYIILPMYVAEIAEDSYRGMLLMSYSTFASLGDLIPYVLGPYVSVLWFNIILAVFPISFLVIFLIIAPESPYYYVNKEDEKAEKILKKLRKTKSKYTATNEIEEIKREKARNVQGDIFNTLKKKYVIKGFLVALGLSSFQQLSGLGAILAYTEIIFGFAGTGLSNEVSAMIVGVVLFLASFAGPLIVDRKGRKFLLTVSALGCIISEIILGAYFYLHEHSDVSLKNWSWVPIACLIIYVVTFNIGFGPLPFTITSEVLPSNVKFYLATVTGFTGWLMSFLVTKFFNDLNLALGIGGTFWLFACFCIAALVFVIFFVPETKGKSFQEIQIFLDR